MAINSEPEKVEPWSAELRCEWRLARLGLEER